MKVRFSVAGPNIKGQVVEAPEGVADHKIVFILGYRPERARTWRGVLPEHRQTWICELVRDTKPGERKGALLVKLIQRDPREVLAEEAQAAVRHWGPPHFIAFLGKLSNRWFKTVCYGYYPYIEGAEAIGLEVCRFDKLLLYKSGETVVTGRTVRWNHAETRLGIKMRHGIEPEEPVHGILPPEAADGFWFWTGKRWEACQEVEVHATSVIVNDGDTETPAHYRFVGLQTASGQLVPNPEEGITTQEFFEIRRIETDEVTDLPMVETPVRKKGWWSADERHRWLEPNLTEGFAPELDEVLARLDEATITQQRVGIESKEVRILINVPGIDPYELVYNPGYQGTGDRYSLRWPTTFLQRSPGRTYRVSSWSEDHKTDPRWKRLMQLLADAQLVAGPVEEEMLTKTGGQFYLGSSKTVGQYAIFCAHGVQVSRACSFSAHGEANWRELLLLAKWDTEACPYGCEEQKGMQPELLLVPEWAAKELGVPEGFRRIELIRAGLDEANPMWRYQYLTHFAGAGWYYTGRVRDPLEMFRRAQQREISVRALEIEPGEYTWEGSVHRRFEGGQKHFQVTFAVEENGDVRVVELEVAEEDPAAEDPEPQPVEDPGEGNAAAVEVEVKPGLVWADTETAVVVGDDGCVRVYTCGQPKFRTEMSFPINWTDIRDARRARRMGLDVEVPEAEYANELPSRAELDAEVAQLVAAREFRLNADVLGHGWVYPGGRTGLVSSGYCRIDEEHVGFYWLPTDSGAAPYNWQLEGASFYAARLRRRVPAELHNRLDAIQSAYLQKEARRKKQEEAAERQRLAKKFGQNHG